MASGLSTRSAAVLLAGVVLAWGTNWPVTKMIVQDVPPLWATALRCMIAAAMLAPMLWAQGAIHRPEARRPAGRVLHLDPAPGGVFGAGRGRAAIRAGGQGDRARLHHADMGRDRRRHVPVGAHHAAARDRYRLRPGGPRGHLQSADAELGRPQRAVRQRPDSARRVLLGRQHRLCPGAQMDLDALPARVLAGIAGGRAALGHRLDHRRRAAHRVDHASRRPDAL